MLPIVLVSLLVSSALAVPVTIQQYSIQEIPQEADGGRLVSSYLTRSAFDNVDGGDTNVYILTAEEVLDDLANLQDRKSQRLAVAQTLAVLGELATGIPGDACESAALVNAYAQSVITGDLRGLRQAVLVFVNRLANNIDLIAQLVTNPNALRNAVGPRGNCAGGGRTYQFDASWRAVLANTSPRSYNLVNEQYCAAKRLYSALNVRSNNVGAALSAAAVPNVVQIVGDSLEPLAAFLRVIARGGNASQQAAVAKSALLRAAGRV